MADKPANAGASGGLAGDLALPPAVHHSDYARPVPGYRPAPPPLAYGPAAAPPPPPLRPEAAHVRPDTPHLRPQARGHRHRTTSRARTRAVARPEATERPSFLSWLPYLLALAGIATGLAVAWNASRDALTGAAVIAGTLLFAALARLVLPPRYAGPLCTRSRAYDVLALTVLGGGVLAVVLTLP
jgi:DUF3017 family protein